MSETLPFDVTTALSRLKGFQRDAVEHAFHRLYEADDSSRRFLLADEVGLGKTLIARGIVARAVEHLWKDVERIDIIYICSHAGIAQQNVRRLNLVHGDHAQLAGRLTLLPLTLPDMSKRRLNFVSFTPGTSLDLKGRGGIAEERRLLYSLLQGAWPTSGRGLQNLLQGGVRDRDRWRESVAEFDRTKAVSDEIREAFFAAIEDECRRDLASGKTPLRERYASLCERYTRYRENLPKADVEDRLAFVGELRLMLARTCVRALEPDLVILDEFQRFKHLLSGEEDGAVLARELFEYSDADADQHVRTLLLSATPYKMYTLAHEKAEDDHYKDFLGTVRFLERGGPRVEDLRRDLESYRLALYQLDAEGMEGLAKHKASIETALRRVMSRTERIGVGGSRDGMLREVRMPGIRLEPEDVRSFVEVAGLAAQLGQGSITGYWKSAPYLANLMDGYQLDKRLVEQVEDPSPPPALAKSLREARSSLIPFDRYDRYEPLQTAHPALRSFADDLEQRGAFEVLWIPPSWPTWQLAAPFDRAEARGLTKRLVFSSWQVVPKALSTLLSYEAERRALRALDEEATNDAAARKNRRGLLRFTMDGDRPQAMTAFALLMPSPTLAAWGHLDAGAGGAAGGRPTVDEVRTLVRARIQHVLSPLLAAAPAEGRADEDWYWAAPLLLDLDSHVELWRWWSADDLASRWLPATSPLNGESADEEETSDDDADGHGAWALHVAVAQKRAREEGPLGRPPDDLVDVLADLALGGLGACALRAMAPVWKGEGGWAQGAVLGAAARIAWQLRLYLNRVESMAIVRVHGRGEAYWRKVLDYAISGGLGAALEEQVHLDRDLQGLFDRKSEEALKEHVTLLGAALGLRSAQFAARRFRVGPRSARVQIDPERMRTHFASRFGRVETDDDKQVQRDTAVRDAFNSPFWPFVLVTTSVGQEGLDFHAWCHAVVHWNLPPNPVDLEQREGRVHRYKGHALRRNVVRRYGGEVSTALGEDRWSQLFERARKGVEGQDHGGLVPYWVFPDPEGFSIERHLLMLPLSRESERIVALQRSLAIYRMVFGQPRQDDLLAWLLENIDSDLLERAAPLLQINLAPATSHVGKARVEE